MMRPHPKSLPEIKEGLQSKGQVETRVYGDIFDAEMKSEPHPKSLPEIKEGLQSKLQVVAAPISLKAIVTKSGKANEWVMLGMISDKNPHPKSLPEIKEGLQSKLQVVAAPISLKAIVTKSGKANEWVMLCSKNRDLADRAGSVPTSAILFDVEAQRNGAVMKSNPLPKFLAMLVCQQGMARHAPTSMKFYDMNGGDGYGA